MRKREDNDLADRHVGNDPILHFSDFKWIADNIVWDKFLPVNGEWEWITKNFPENCSPQNHHPLKEEHFAFTDRVITPYVRKIYSL